MSDIKGSCRKIYSEHEASCRAPTLYTVLIELVKDSLPDNLSDVFMMASTRLFMKKTLFLCNKSIKIEP